MLARVMTFSASGDVLDSLVDTLRREVGEAYRGIPGFRGLLAMHNPDRRDVVALTLWEDQAGIDASADLATSVLHQITSYTGLRAATEIFEVIGNIGLIE